MTYLAPVIAALKWTVRPEGSAACRRVGCTVPGLRRLNLCTKHTAEYRRVQHKLAMKRINAARSLERAAKRVTKQAKKVEKVSRGARRSPGGSTTRTTA